jgi:hypothetical protein
LVNGEALSAGLPRKATSARSVGAGQIGLGHLGASSSAITFIGDTLAIVSRPARRDAELA